MKRRSHALDWANFTDDRVRQLRDYDTSSKVRRQARQELAERSVLATLSDEAIRATIEICIDPDVRARARHEWARRQARSQARPHVAQEAEHAAG